jgi:hypothetical protein
MLPAFPLFTGALIPPLLQPSVSMFLFAADQAIVAFSTVIATT